jgi:hypothetical protein
LQLVDSFDGRPDAFHLAAPRPLLDPVGINMAIITDRVTARAWQRDGFIRARPQPEEEFRIARPSRRVRCASVLQDGHRPFQIFLVINFNRLPSPGLPRPRTPATLESRQSPSPPRSFPIPSPPPPNCVTKHKKYPDATQSRFANSKFFATHYTQHHPPPQLDGLSNNAKPVLPTPNPQPPIPTTPASIRDASVLPIRATVPDRSSS